MRKIAIVLAAALMMTACGNNSAAETISSSKAAENKAERQIFAMDTYMTVQVFGEKAEECADQAEEEILRIDRMLSTGNENSEISKLNQAGQASVSAETEALIRRALQISQDTDGAFDITIYPLMEAWGFTNGEFRVPGEQELGQLLPLVDYKGVSVKDRQVSLKTSGAKIDLGGIAKGYTSDRLIEMFSEAGVKHAIVSLGGNVQVLGDKTDGSLWRVGIRDPKDESAYVGVLEIKDQAVITSGNYERYFEEDNIRYHHILDPETGRPAENGLASVTIVSADGTLADGLSTALFVMGLEKGSDYWRQHADQFQAIFVSADGKVSVTEGLTDSFSSESEVETITREG